MCINKEVSLSTFISSWIVGFYLWTRNHKYDKWFALFLFTFSAIQYWEFLLWILKEKNMLGTGYDFAISKVMIPITLCLELIVPYLGLLWYQNGYKWNIGAKLWQQLTTSFYPYILLIYIIFFIVKTAQRKQEATTVSPQGSLQWNSNFQTKKGAYISAFLFAFFLAYPFKDASMLIPIYLVISVLFALAVSDSFGSYWCFIANFSTFFFLMYPYLGK